MGVACRCVLNAGGAARQRAAALRTPPDQRGARSRRPCSGLGDSSRNFRCARIIRGALAQAGRFFHMLHALQLALQPLQRVHRADVRIAALLQKVLAIRTNGSSPPSGGHLPAAHAKNMPRERSRSIPHELSSEVRQRLLRAQHRLHVARQLLEARVAQPDAEVCAGNIFQLMRLVEDDRGRLGQNSRIRRAAPPVCLMPRSAKNRWWFTMMMSLSSALRRISVMKHCSKSGQLCPRQASVRASIFCQSWLFSGSAFNSARSPVDGRLLPRGDLVELVDLLQAGEHRLIAQRIELVLAEIVRAALHVADAQRPQQRLQERNVLEVELFLQVFRAGGDDDALLLLPRRAQCRQQVGERLAGAGACLHDQVALLLKRLLHGPRHLILAAPELELQLGARECAARRKKIVERWQGTGGFHRIGQGIGHLNGEWF